MHFGGKSVLYNCSYCEKDVTNLLRIECAECSPSKRFCGDCFSAGVAIDNHSANHAYHVIQCLDRSIFSKDWIIPEEVQLLEGMYVLNSFYKCGKITNP